MQDGKKLLVVKDQMSHKSESFHFSYRGSGSVVCKFSRRLFLSHPVNLEHTNNALLLSDEMQCMYIAKRFLLKT